MKEIIKEKAKVYFQAKVKIYKKKMINSLARNAVVMQIKMMILAISSFLMPIILIISALFI